MQNETNEQRAPLLIAGTFLVCGHHMLPAYMLADESTRAFYRNRLEKHGMERTARVFHPLADFAMPADSLASLEFIALEYCGAHESSMRGMAAALALGHPLGSGRDLSEGPRDDDNGGRRAALVPEQPLAPAPTNAAPLFDDAAQESSAPAKATRAPKARTLAPASSGFDAL